MLDTIANCQAVEFITDEQQKAIKGGVIITEDLDIS